VAFEENDGGELRIPDEGIQLSRKQGAINIPIKVKHWSFAKWGSTRRIHIVPLLGNMAFKASYRIPTPDGHYKDVYSGDNDVDLGPLLSHRCTERDLLKWYNFCGGPLKTTTATVDLDVWKTSAQYGSYFIRPQGRMGAFHFNVTMAAVNVKIVNAMQRAPAWLARDGCQMRSIDSVARLDAGFACTVMRSNCSNLTVLEQPFPPAGLAAGSWPVFGSSGGSGLLGLALEHAAAANSALSSARIALCAADHGDFYVRGGLRLFAELGVAVPSLASLCRVAASPFFSSSNVSTTSNVRFVKAVLLEKLASNHTATRDFSQQALRIVYSEGDAKMLSAVVEMILEWDHSDSWYVTDKVLYMWGLVLEHLEQEQQEEKVAALLRVTKKFSMKHSNDTYELFLTWCDVVAAEALNGEDEVVVPKNLQLAAQRGYFAPRSLTLEGGRRLAEGANTPRLILRLRFAVKHLWINGYVNDKKYYGHRFLNAMRKLSSLQILGAEMHLANLCSAVCKNRMLVDMNLHGLLLDHPASHVQGASTRRSCLEHSFRKPEGLASLNFSQPARIAYASAEVRLNRSLQVLPLLVGAWNVRNLSSLDMLGQVMHPRDVIALGERMAHPAIVSKSSMKDFRWSCTAQGGFEMREFVCDCGLPPLATMVKKMTSLRHLTFHTNHDVVVAGNATAPGSRGCLDRSKLPALAKVVSELSALSSLDLAGASAASLLSSLPPSAQLRSLKMRHATLSLSALEQELRKFPQLEYLDISHNGLDSDSLEALLPTIRNISSLRTLFVEQTVITNLRKTSSWIKYQTDLVFEQYCNNLTLTMSDLPCGDLFRE